MEPKQLSELPVIFQVVAGAGLFTATFLLGIGGWLWKQIKPKEDTPHGDAVVLTAAIADTASIKALAGAIDRLIDFLKEEAEDDAHRDRKNREVLCEIRDSVEGLAKVVKTRTIM